VLTEVFLTPIDSLVGVGWIEEACAWAVLDGIPDDIFLVMVVAVGNRGTLVDRLDMRRRAISMEPGIISFSERRQDIAVLFMFIGGEVVAQSQ
jgi:hypothetical protein